MEIYGPFLQEDEKYVEEVRRRKDFNNIYLGFPGTTRRTNILDWARANSFAGDNSRKENIKRTKLLFQEIDNYILKNDFNYQYWLDSRKTIPDCSSFKGKILWDSLQLELVPLYIHLRKQGFSESEICK